MATTFSASVAQKCDVSVTLDASILPAFLDRSIYLTGFSSSANYPESSVTFVYANKFTAGTTLDLTNLTDPVFGNVNLDTKTVQVVLINNLSTTESLTVSGTYPILGGTLTIPSEGRILLRKPTGTAVSPSAKTIVFSGSSSYEVLLVV